MPSSPISLLSFLSERAEKAATVSTMATTAIDEPFAEGWDASATVGDRISTGVSFFDHLLDGGQVVGETYGLLGPYGGGKSTMGRMLSVRAAERSYVDWEAGGCVGTPARAYHFNYEDRIEQVRSRALSYLSGIPVKTIEAAMQTRNYREFGDTPQTGGSGRTTQQSFDRALTVLNACWRPVDMTGSDKRNPGRGSGLVDEAAMIIRSDIERVGCKVSIVVVDYVLAAINTHLGAAGKDFSELRHYVNRWPLNMQRKIGGPFECPVWSLHQLSTAANAARAGFMPKATDASEGRAFAENCDFCFVITTANRSGNAAIAAPKHRRTGDLGPVVVQLRGDNARVDDMSEHWTLDEASGTICERSLTDNVERDSSTVPFGPVSDEQSRHLRNQAASRPTFNNRANR